MRSESLSVPKDCRTLLKTPTVCNNIVNVPPGEYIHFGIEKGILYMMHQSTLPQNLDVLPLMINIDGLPLCKSSNSQFWPILMSIDLTKYSEVFIVGVYHGTKKPESVISFLNALVEEYLLLKKNGIIVNGKLIKLELRKIICDAPATAFVLSIKSHTGYFGCNKCLQKGKYLRGKMTFPKLNATLRSNESFRLQLQQEHHKGITPLEKIGIGLVSNVPLDYMHLVCLGVMKTLLMFWIGKKGRNSIKLHDNYIKEMSKTLRVFRKYISQDFCRLPRRIEDIDNWKATEFRQFLLYTGPIVLKGKLPKEQYKHFLCLHVAIRILCSSECISLNMYAKRLIEYFVVKYKKIYGKEYITYNMHNLLHLHNDVLLFGKLDNFSAFRFESYMSKIKRNLKNSRYPLQQIYNRITEERNLIYNKKKLSLLQDDDKSLIYNENGKTYTYLKKIIFNNQIISLCQRNNCVLLKNSSCIMLISDIYKTENNNIKIVGRTFKSVSDFVHKPSFSLSIKVVDIHKMTNISTFDYEDIKSKCVMLPFNDKFAIIPILHNNE
ncbi:hypothetical protein ALC62_14272 [Cyphomyrmex costatus]|uniref:Transposase domain-containing protein n=1 Tax=Cyphomyrmex costatus TaxID=456900 RepID=A0A151I904_9HYME|nr:hypothetical protein ALC62_14272 [Cyphomyrmex costatus]